MNSLSKKLLTLVGLTASIIAMVFINTVVIDPSKYQDANSTKDRMTHFVKETAVSVVSKSKKGFNIATFDFFKKEDNNTNTVLKDGEEIYVSNIAFDSNGSNISRNGMKNIHHPVNIVTKIDKNVTVNKRTSVSIHDKRKERKNVFNNNK